MDIQICRSCYSGDEAGATLCDMCGACTWMRVDRQRLALNPRLNRLERRIFSRAIAKTYKIVASRVPQK